MNNNERFDRLDRFIETGNLIRNQWTEGQERACLLAAISPEVGENESTTACPVSVIPQWLANLTPNMDDNGTIEEWLNFVKRYASILRQAANKLDIKAWQRIEYRVRALLVQEAKQHTQNVEVLKICDQVINLCQGVVNGEEIDTEKFFAMRIVANKATWSAARCAAWWAADIAAYAVGYAAGSVARNAATSAAETARNAATSAAWDRMNTGILDAIELELKK